MSTDGWMNPLYSPLRLMSGDNYSNSDLYTEEKIHSLCVTNVMKIHLILFSKKTPFQLVFLLIFFFFLKNLVM